MIIDYDDLPAVTAVLDAAAGDAPLLHEDAPGNIAFRKRLTAGDAAVAFQHAAYTVSQRMTSQRLAPVAMEPRGVLAFPADDGRIEVRLPTQRAHGAQNWLAKVLGIPPARLHVMTGDVGGGFGAKGPLYPDQVAVIAAAMALGRPVKWIEERSESFTATTHGRDQVADLELAADEDGNITAMRGTVHASMGAYFTANGPGSLLGRLGPMLPQAYRLQHFDVELVGVFANTTPIGPYRGAGRPEAAYFTERLVDMLAREMHADPAELRRRNFIPSAAFPFTTVTGLTYESGDYHAGLDLLQEKFDADSPQRRRPVPPGHLRGRGIATFVEPGGIVPRAPGPDGTIGDKATVTIGPDGKVTVAVGTSGHGQGHETAFAQLAADLLGVAYDDVTVVFGDTDAAPFGYGTFGSRSLAAGGTAIYHACQAALDAARRVDAPMPVSRGGGPPRRHPGDRFIRRAAGDLRLGRVRLRGRRRPGDRPGHAAAGDRGRRLRRARQPAAGRGPGARRRRPGRRPGAHRAGQLRRERPAHVRVADGLRGAVRGDAPAHRVLLGRHPVHRSIPLASRAWASRARSASPRPWSTPSWTPSRRTASGTWTCR